MSEPVYMDNNATTQVDPRVLEAMLPYFSDVFGNAASRNHSFGWQAEEAVDKARAQVADLFGADPKEIVFTSGATESDNIALRGAAEMYAEKGDHIVTSHIEHKAILDTGKYLERYGKRVTYLEPDETGQTPLEQIEQAIDDGTILVSIMLANNEIGTLNRVADIGELCRHSGVLFHTDAVQAVGKVPIDVDAMNIDIMSISGHKIYGPKGIGALYVRRKKPRVRLSAVIHGGGHERGMRSGTLNVPGIVGLGAALEVAKADMQSDHQRILALRDRLEQGITGRLDMVTLNGHPAERLAGTSNLSFAYVEGEALMMGMKNVAVSSGSACTSASLEPSFVLRHIGVGDELAHSSIRFSLGRFNTEAEVDFVVEQVVQAVERLREMSPLWEMAREGIDPAEVKWPAV